jgi:hypothetical protein
MQVAGRTMIVSHATTLCGRTRGGLSSAVQEIEVASDAVTLRACVWEGAAQDFVPRQDRVFAR